MNKRRCLASFFVLLICLVSAAEAQTSQVAEADTRDAFFEAVARQCGASFEGTSSFPADPDDAFFGKPLVARVASCTSQEIRIPFAVGNDHSRTWILTRGARGLRLQHDHRHADGTPDEVTMYGGWAGDQGTELSQSFAADQHTRDLIPAAATNVWTLSFDAEGGLTYYLERHQKPRFKATLTRVDDGS